MAGRRPPPPTVVVHDLPMRERLDRLERAMALLGDERIARPVKLATVGISATVMER